MSIAAVFQIGSLGDSIVSVPALLSIRELLPNCSEYLLVSRVDSNLNVLPSHVFDMAWKPKVQINFEGPNRGIKEVASIGSLILRLRHYNPRYAVYLMPADRSRQQVERDKVFFKIGGVKELIGFRALELEELTAQMEPNVKDTEAYLRMRRLWNHAADETFARYSSQPLLRPSDSAKQRVKTWLETKRRYPERRLIVVCPYSNQPSKDIPDAHIVKLLPQLEKSACCEVVIVGGQKDSDRAQSLIRLSSVGINSCGTFTLEESAALIQDCALMVCADSGPMHLAGALGVSSLIVFSRMNKQLHRWFPFSSKHTVLYRELECAGCKAIKCPIKEHPCMEDITAEQILTVALRKLAGQPVQQTMLGDTRVAHW